MQESTQGSLCGAGGRGALGCQGQRAYKLEEAAGSPGSGRHSVVWYSRDSKKKLICEKRREEPRCLDQVRVGQ